MLVNQIASVTSQCLRRADNSIQENPSDNSNSKIRSDFSPEHVNIRAAKRIFVAACLFPSFPDGEKTKAEREAHGHGSDLVIARRRHFEGVAVYPKQKIQE